MIAVPLPSSHFSIFPVSLSNASRTSFALSSFGMFVTVTTLVAFVVFAAFAGRRRSSSSSSRASARFDPAPERALAICLDTPPARRRGGSSSSEPCSIRRKPPEPVPTFALAFLLSGCVTGYKSLDDSLPVLPRPSSLPPRPHGWSSLDCRSSDHPP